MDASKRNLVFGLVGIAILLIGVLVYAQLSAAHHFELNEYHQRAD